MKNVVRFEFNGNEVVFEMDRDNVMVNATQMAKIFGKEVSGFLKTEQTKNFVDAFCRTENIPSENEFTPEGKVIKTVSTGRKTGCLLAWKTTQRAAGIVQRF